MKIVPMGKALMTTLVLLPLLACQGKDAQKESKNAPNKTPLVEVTVIQRERLVQKIELTGDVVATQVARLGSPAEGVLLSLPKREGDWVAKGSLLAQIGRKQGAEALVQSLQKDLEFKELDLKRTRDLAQSGAVPGENLQKAEVTVEVARAQLTKAQESMVDYSVTAPWDGILSMSKVTAGEYVAPRQTLLEMYDPASLRIVAMLPEKDALKAKIGSKLEITLDAYANEKFTGKVVRIYPALDPRTRSRRLEISMEQQVPLIPGMFARMQLQMAQIDSALVVPMKAVITNPKKGSTAFVLKGKQVHIVPLQLGMTTSGKAQVLKGLQEGDTIITEGMGRLKDGMQVRLPGAKQ